MSGGSATYSVVVPIYCNEGTLGAVIDRLRELTDRVACAVEAVFVVDGSPDASATVLRRLLREEQPFRSQMLVLSRNFGSFSAIRAGLALAEGDLVAVMAADLQEPLHLLEDFRAALADGDCDIALGVREERADPRASRAASSLFWRLYRRFVQRDMPAQGVDMFACTRQVATELLRLGESHSSLVGLLLWLGFRRVEVPYRRTERQGGRSAWSTRRKVRYLLDSVFSFSDLPIHLITALGAAGVGLTTLLALVVLIARAAGAITVAGYTPLMLVIAFIGSTTLLSLGVIGSYVWRTYENTKGRPSAIPLSVEHFPAS